jgi:predicted flap endonuclease-1-like 5' DNA nuclease
MADILNQYWLVIVIALLLVVAAVVFFVPRRDPRAGRIARDAPRAPLEPRKPDIVAAKRNAFADPPTPAPAERVAPTTATPPTIDPLPAAPDPIPAPAAAPAGGASDDLSAMKGVGPKLVARLAALGVTRFDQIARWSEADIDRIDGALGNFAGRIRRDDWVEQARLLAAGDRAGFEAKFGALG